MLVYLLHFDRPIGRAQHYLGITQENRLHTRMREHAAGHGSRLTGEAVRLGIGWTVVRTWSGMTWQDEQMLKRRGRYATRCSRCSPHLTPPAGADILLHVEPVLLPSAAPLLNW